MTGRAPLLLGLGLVVAGLAILGIGALAGMTGPAGSGAANPGGPAWSLGSPGFVPGTAASPRVVGSR